MLLVYDNHADIFKRRENRAARADCNHCFSRFESMPLVKSLTRRQTAMQQRDLVLETVAEKPHDVGSKRNFRHKHNCRFVVFNRVLYHAHINFCFAAARHSVQQIHSACRFYTKDGVLLLLGKDMRDAFRLQAAIRHAPDGYFTACDNTFLF